MRKVGMSWEDRVKWLWRAERVTGPTYPSHGRETLDVSLQGRSDPHYAIALSEVRARSVRNGRQADRGVPRDHPCRTKGLRERNRRLGILDALADEVRERRSAAFRTGRGTRMEVGQ